MICHICGTPERTTPGFSWPTKNYCRSCDRGEEGSSSRILDSDHSSSVHASFLAICSSRISRTASGMMALPLFLKKRSISVRASLE